MVTNIRKWIERSFGIGILTYFFLMLSVTPVLCANIVVDHTNWDWYNSQPQCVVDRVASLKVFFAHASVGTDIMGGFLALHTANGSQYPLNQSSTGDTPPGTTSSGTIYEYDRGNPGWSAKISDFVDYLNNDWHDPVVGIVMNKFCFIDQDADWTAYRDSMVALEAAYPNTKLVYWTMPIMTSSDSDNVLRAQFNQNLRNWMATQNNKLLFDIADIEAWSPDGVHQTFTYNGQTYEQMYADYSTDGGHPNEEASDRLATGLYSLFGLATGPASRPILYATFTGGGLWQWGGTVWSQVNPVSPTTMVASGSLLYGNFGSGGLWQWNGATWSQVNAVSPTTMVTSGSLLYGNFGSGGLWQWNGATWSQVNAVAPNNMVTSSSILYGDFGSGGLWQWDGTAWSMVNAVAPNNMVTSSSILYGDFGSGGLWQWDGTAWSMVNAVAPNNMVTSSSILYGDFGSGGLWQWDGTAWSMVNAVAPNNMVTSSSILYGDFGSGGLWQWDGTAWSMVNAVAPTSMVGGF